MNSIHLGMPSHAFRVAVILPAHNEEKAVADTVTQFRSALPEATVYVIENASSDGTYAAAKKAGAIVISEPTRGKGNAVRRAFADIDADIYVMADADGTYEPAKAPAMVASLVVERLDMVVGIRDSEAVESYRPGHRAGNWLFNKVIHYLFHSTLTDVFSGYRVMSRRFVKSFPAISHGFEIETELTVHALELHLPIREISTRYGKRASGTHSKLSTWRDGIRILWTILLFTKQYRPFALYGLVAVLLAVLSISLGAPIVREFFETGLVPRLPTAVLATGIMLLAALSLTSGLVLHSVSRIAIETKRLFYLGLPTLSGCTAPDLAHEKRTTEPGKN